MSYVFFTYWSRTKEKHIADEIDFNRMINASSFNDAFKVLQDTDYAPYALNKKAEDYKGALKEEKEELKKTLQRMGLEKEVLALLDLEQKDVLETKIKDSKVKVFLKEYGEILQSFFKNLKQENLQSAKKDEEALLEKEKEFILKAEIESEGLSPLFSYFLKKKRAEKVLSLILSSKKLGLPGGEVGRLINSVRGL